MAKVTIPEGLTGKDLFSFLVNNKKALLAEKKFSLKFSDPCRLEGLYADKHGELSKAAPVDDDEDQDVIKRACVINTTNWMDSHSDVHIPGIWKKSLAETKTFYLLQEHRMTFEKIITDDLKAYTKRMSWRSLGLDIDGDTEALIFDANIPKDRNPFMFNEYKSNRVKNHSVGMRYHNLELAINNEDYKEEFAVWNKYIDKIANKNAAEEQGFFWAIKEAGVVEGSAVPIGSNVITPTLESGTGKQPSFDTGDQPQDKGFDLSKAIQDTKFII